MFVLIIFFLLEIPVLGEGGRICRRVPYKDGYVSYWPSGDGEMAVQKKKGLCGPPPSSDSVIRVTQVRNSVGKSYQETLEFLLLG